MDHHSPGEQNSVMGEQATDDWPDVVHAAGRRMLKPPGLYPAESAYHRCESLEVSQLQRVQISTSGE
jgi:hypothetical protein